MTSLRRLRLPAALLLIAASLAVSGCSKIVPLQPAADANNPACAQVSVTLPDEVAGISRVYTNAQATGAWGEPSAVVLHCGVAVPGPTTDSCVSVNDVDWIVDETEAADGFYRFTTYGRTPAVEVYLNGDPSTGVASSTVLTDLSSSMKRIESTRACTNLTDVVGN